MNYNSIFDEYHKNLVNLWWILKTITLKNRRQIYGVYTKNHWSYSQNCVCQKTTTFTFIHGSFTADFEVKVLCWIWAFRHAVIVLFYLFYMFYVGLLCYWFISLAFLFYIFIAHVLLCCSFIFSCLTITTII